MPAINTDLLEFKIRAYVNTVYTIEVKRDLATHLEDKALAQQQDETEKHVNELLPALEKIAKKSIPGYARYELTQADKVAMIDKIVGEWTAQQDDAVIRYEVAKILKNKRDQKAIETEMAKVVKAMGFLNAIKKELDASSTGNEDQE